MVHWADLPRCAYCQATSNRTFSVQRANSSTAPQRQVLGPSISHNNTDNTDHGQGEPHGSEPTARVAEGYAHALPLPIILGPGEQMDSPLGLLAKQVEADNDKGAGTSSSYFPETKSWPGNGTGQQSTGAMLQAPPIQFSAFRDSTFSLANRKGLGSSTYSIADTLGSQGEWADDYTSRLSTLMDDNDSRYGGASSSVTHGESPSEQALRENVMRALQVAALGPSSVPLKPQVISSGNSVESSRGAKLEPTPGTIQQPPPLLSSTSSPNTSQASPPTLFMDPDQQSMAAEICAGKIVHTRPAPPPPIQESIEMLDSSTSRNVIGGDSRDKYGQLQWRDSPSIKRAASTSSGGPSPLPLNASRFPSGSSGRSFPSQSPNLSLIHI